MQSKIKYLLILVIVAWAYHTPRAQTTVFSDYYLKHWDTDDGLPVDLLLSITQTKDGFIWLRTYNGLIRFDGVSFEVFDSKNVLFLTQDGISAFLESSDTTLWVTSPFAGLWNYKDGKVDLAFGDCNPGSRLYWLKSSGKIVFSNADIDYPFLSYDPISKTKDSLSNDDIQNLFSQGEIQLNKNLEDQTGYTWSRTSRGMERSKNGISEEVIIHSDKGRVVVFDIMVDSRDRIWAATSYGLYIWNGVKMVPFAGSELLRALPVSAPRGQNWILEDHDGGIWFVLFDRIGYLPQDSEQLQFPPVGHPLNELLVTSMLLDQEGNIWLSTQGGLVRLSKGVFKVYSKDEGLPNQQVEVTAALKNGDYLISTINGGLSVNQEGNIIPYDFNDPSLKDLNLNNFYHMFTDSKGNTWGSARFGIFKFSDGKEEWLYDESSVRFGFEDFEGKIWFGLYDHGIGFFNDDEELEFLDLDSFDFENYDVSSLLRLRNGGWGVTTFNQGFLLFDADGRLIKLENDQGLGSTGCFRSYEDKEGIIWVCSQSGLFRIKNSEVNRLSHESGIPTTSIFDFIPDENGFVWIPSSIGIIKVSISELNHYIDRDRKALNWRIFDEGDGMKSRSCTGARHGTVMPDGRILFGTLDGVVEIDPNFIISNEIPPPVIINQLLWDDQNISLTDNLTFDPGQHRFIFSYSGLSFTAPKKVEFKFILEGYDEDWIRSTGDRRAFYTNVPFGDYTFKVQAANNDGVWNEEGDSISFTVKRPWYHTWLAYLSYGMFFLLGVFSIQKVQAKKLLKRQKELSQQKELEHAREIEKAFVELEQSHLDLKSTQAQLIQSEKMASLGELTAGIAHEIQNPLNFVNNFSDVSGEMIEEISEELEKGEIAEVKDILNDLKGNLEKIHHHGGRASGIVRSMLDHSRASSAERVETNINALCDEYIRLAYHGLRAKDRSFNADFKTVFDESLPKIKVAAQDIGRVILNILNNAFYAVNQKKKSNVSDSYNPLVEIRTTQLDEEKEGVQITISDNGIGMAAETKEKVFQPFFTTKPTGQGTGLGMSLAYDIVQAHGGSINLESKEGEGTTFIINLPKDS